LKTKFVSKNQLGTVLIGNMFLVFSLYKMSMFVDVSGSDQQGPAPITTHWTVLCLDLQQILSIYLNRRHSYLKSIRLCANLTVRNVFTSDAVYQPG
jgi:Protein of unknown function (DUF667)